jgi:hypothetical protein
MLILRDFDWNEFFERLGGPEGLNLRTENGRERWNCSNKSDYPHSRKILADMGVEESRMDAFLEHFKKHGGYCDCEVMLNVMFAMQPHDELYSK